MTTHQAARRLRAWGFVNAIVLETWQTHEITKGATTLRITAAPGRHHRLPGVAALLPRVMGSVLEFTAPDGPLSVYVTGDTMVHEDLREIPRRHPELDLGLWHLGGTRVLGLLVTMDATQGAELLEIVRPRTTVPIHYDDYGVFKSPLADFLAEVARRGLAGVVPIARGDVLDLEARRGVAPR